MWGGVEEVEIDPEYGYFYVHRDNGMWNRYLVDAEEAFFALLVEYSDDIPFYELDASGERI